ncbi:MAG: RES family NAD+ phosphorylase [Burkholderiales bacterium]|nr:RES family NAD+ phosphorylase [Burkholderiales bacterium]
MATRLPPPPPAAKLKLRIKNIDATKRHRVSRFSSGEPFFGRSGANRFDDTAMGFGTCYLGFDVPTAVAETVLHDEMPVRSRISVAQTDFDSRQLVRLPMGGTLRLADFTGAALKALVGDSSISTVMPYDPPQQWAAAVHAHPAIVDGICYVSRQSNDRKSVVVFDRAKSKPGTATYCRLGSWSGLKRLRNTLSIDYAAP